MIAKLLALTPLPNNFRTGDGLNTAGYTWSRRATNDRDQVNVKVDHTFKSSHNASFSFTREIEDNANGNNAQPFPDAPGGKFATEDYFYSLSLTSTLYAADGQRIQSRLTTGSNPRVWVPGTPRKD